MSVIRLTESELVEMIQQVISEKKKKRKKKKKKSKKKNTTLCSRGKKAAQAKFEVYPSAYANGYAVQVCKGTMPGLDGKKRCSGKYCSGKK
jgi:phosphoribosylamine-glycine ligase